MTLVLDASVVVQLLAGDPRAGSLVAERDLWSVHLMPFEVLNVLRRQEQAGRLPARLAAAMVDDLRALPVSLAGADALALDTWRLRGSLTAYDASYVALAGALGCELLTCDARLARAAGPGARVRPLGAG